MDISGDSGPYPECCDNPAKQNEKEREKKHDLSKCQALRFLIFCPLPCLETAARLYVFRNALILSKKEWRYTMDYRFSAEEAFAIVDRLADDQAAIIADAISEMLASGLSLDTEEHPAHPQTPPSYHDFPGQPV